MRTATNKLVLVRTMNGTRVHLADPSARKRTPGSYLYRPLCKAVWTYRTELAPKGGSLDCLSCKQIVRQWWTSRAR